MTLGRSRFLTAVVTVLLSVSSCVLASPPEKRLATLSDLIELAKDGDPLIMRAVAFKYKDLGDDKSAFVWLEKAAEKDDPVSLSALSAYYMNEMVVPRNPEKAFSLALRAAKLRDYTAHSNLGTLYSLGIGTPRDLVQGYAWYSVALDDSGSDPRILGYLDSTASKIKSSVELQRAKDLSREYIELYGSKAKVNLQGVDPSDPHHTHIRTLR
ncbi:tetratricopeptide repeat protein [Pseudomonas protegens]|uniref:tetratricopeptide repeat protein n=2 Tax=Pseudomonadota TaxID=1224 RepID=UPI0024C2DAB0|nr:tetratricopeptide repeat protein [Pseudomonas protegens]MDK1397922.1 tetratricopeptide repeat protein [Pseudomonas protegens]